MQINPQRGKMGMRASSTNEVVFQDTPVPAEGPARRGRPMGSATLWIFSTPAASSSPPSASASDRPPLEEAVRYAQQRESFGRPIAQHQAIQFMLADMATDVHAARTATMQAATLKDQGLPFVNEASMAKLLASEMCVKVTFPGVAGPRRIRILQGLAGGAAVPGRPALPPFTRARRKCSGWSSPGRCCSSTPSNGWGSPWRASGRTARGLRTNGAGRNARWPKPVTSTT